MKIVLINDTLCKKSRDKPMISPTKSLVRSEGFNGKAQTARHL